MAADTFIASLSSRLAALESIFGRSQRVLHSPVPFYLGGDADILQFHDRSRNAIILCTHTMTGGWGSGQRPVEGREYEFVIAVPENSPLAPRSRGDGAIERGWAATLLNGYAKYSKDVELKPGDTSGPLPAAFGNCRQLLFWELTNAKHPFQYDGASYGLRLCLGITQPEADLLEHEDAASLVLRLRAAGHFPLTITGRESVA
mgnify:CR=1 FL=1